MHLKELVSTVMKTASTRARCVTRNLVYHFTTERNSLQHLSAKSSDILSKTGIQSKPLYSQDGNYWIKTQGEKAGKEYTVVVGLTKYAFDTAIAGSIDSITVPPKDDHSSTSLKIHWSGLKVGTGDELYHSVWENVNETLVVEPFLPIKLSAIPKVDYNFNSMKNSESLEDDEWLIRFNTSDSSLQLLGISLSSMKTQEQHDAFCDFESKAAQSL